MTQAKVLDFPADRIAKGSHGYYPEMNERKPNCQIEASLTYGSKWYIKTPLVLKGRGITHVMTYAAKDLTPKAQHKIGWHAYEATKLAFESIKAKYSISVEILLD